MYYFGGAESTPTIISSYSFQTKKIRFLTDDVLANAHATQQQILLSPLGYAQFTLTPYHSELFRSEAVYAFDRMRVLSISIVYTPTGTESVISTAVAQAGAALSGAIPRVPYANLPLIFAYDPTVNDANALEVIRGFPTDATSPAELVQRGIQAMSATRKATGESTKTFRSRIESPKTLVVRDNGVNPELSGGRLDIGSLMHPSLAYETNVARGRSIATYGTFTVLVPRGENLAENVNPTIDVNLTIVYRLALYGRN